MRVHVKKVSPLSGRLGLLLALCWFVVPTDAGAIEPVIAVSEATATLGEATVTAVESGGGTYADYFAARAALSEGTAPAARAAAPVLESAVPVARSAAPRALGLLRVASPVLRWAGPVGLGTWAGLELAEWKNTPPCISTGECVSIDDAPEGTAWIDELLAQPDYAPRNAPGATGSPIGEPGRPTVVIEPGELQEQLELANKRRAEPIVLPNGQAGGSAIAEPGTTSWRLPLPGELFVDPRRALTLRISSALGGLKQVIGNNSNGGDPAADLADAFLELYKSEVLSREDLDPILSEAGLTWTDIHQAACARHDAACMDEILLQHLPTWAVPTGQLEHTTAKVGAWEDMIAVIRPWDNTPTLPTTDEDISSTLRFLRGLTNGQQKLAPPDEALPRIAPGAPGLPEITDTPQIGEPLLAPGATGAEQQYVLPGSIADQMLDLPGYEPASSMSLGSYADSVRTALASYSYADLRTKVLEYNEFLVPEGWVPQDGPWRERFDGWQRWQSLDAELKDAEAAYRRTVGISHTVRPGDHNTTAVGLALVETGGRVERLRRDAASALLDYATITLDPKLRQQWTTNAYEFRWFDDSDAGVMEDYNQVSD